MREQRLPTDMAGDPRPVEGHRGGHRAVRWLPWLLLACTAAALAGCGGGSGSASAASSVQDCGTARTAANVPVEVEVRRGQVSCTAALRVEAAYASAIRAGKAPGNGGGGPVPADGWTCQGYPTPELLKTGEISRCTRSGEEILAILKSSGTHS